MVITVLSRDKISQNMFHARITNIASFVVVGTHGNQDENTFNERLAFIQSQKQDVIVFHALKKSAFAIDKDWQPEPTADFPRALYDASDAVVYTPTLFQSSYGKQLTVLKGDISGLKLS
jgi:hypothetical protein